ncbi:hypothetical protein ANCDUO_25388 [Ancylostoma duodenale]|uniref:Uncharacterized protein n=1 Tax=Ancylostoma duodenale TaxID=51022 RepID=A0A0C2FI01_9BILA|nr:hypothetical protein ANCDUO_25388 [Ancylostoma duodenale]
MNETVLNDRECALAHSRAKILKCRGFFEWTSEHLFGFYRNMIIIVNCVLVSTLLIHEGVVQGEIVSVCIHF